MRPCVLPLLLLAGCVAVDGTPPGGPGTVAGDAGVPRTTTARRTGSSTGDCSNASGRSDACLALGPQCGYCFDDGQCRSEPNLGGEFEDCQNWEWGSLPPEPEPEPVGCGVCAAGETCVDGVCVGAGDLRFTLRWSVSTDMDLHVVTPSGTEISYRNRMADSGMLDVDNVQGGPNSVENVFFTHPLSGSYRVWVHNFSGREGGAFELEVVRGSQVIGSFPGTLPASSEATSPEQTVDFH